MDWMLALLVVVLLEAVVIVALWFERRRLGRASREARQLAEELSHMVHLAVLAELATSVSSQLAQPTTAMLINIETALTTLRSSTPDLKMLREIVEDLHADCGRIAALVNQLRDRPMSQPRFRPLDLNVALGNVLELIRMAAQRDGIEVQTAFAAGLPMIAADPIQVLGVVMHLCMNSIEVLRHDSRTPRVLRIATSVDAGVVTVSVRDSARGVTAKRVPLLIAERIVESHGGRLWINPDPEGTTWGFALPVLLKE
jgi:signal transduction histidine kinase